MKVLSPAQVKELDAYTIANEPVLSVNLMERAAQACVAWIEKKIGVENNFKVFAGPGNNGGDALAIARLLANKGYYCEVYILSKLSSDALINYNRLIEQNKCKVLSLRSEDNFPIIEGRDVIIDGIFGAGLSKPVEGLPAILINYLNDCGARIISIDIPSGLFPEDNTQLEISEESTKYVNIYKNVIRATYTLTLETPFYSFFFRESDQHVGDWYIMDIHLHKEKKSSIETLNYFVTADVILEKLKKRRKFDNKGNFGHALLVAGSYGKMGAAVLAAMACHRSGVGRLTAHIPKHGYTVMLASTPETMVNPDTHEEYFTALPNLNKYSYDAIGVGPGLGYDNNETHLALRQLLKNARVPLVIDADAINILGEHPEWLDLIPEGSIFTPHPREFERLLGKSENYFVRAKKQSEFAKKYKVYVVLKGAFSAIVCPDGSCYFNSTGNPGMAAAGSGDVLTGVILALLAQGYSSEDAAIIGVYLHGLSGDIAVQESGEESLIASDLCTYLGKAYKYAKEGKWIEK